MMAALLVVSSACASSNGDDAGSTSSADAVVLQRADVPDSYESDADEPGRGFNEVVRSCLAGPTPTSTAASDNFTSGQELVYSFAEQYASPDDARTAFTSSESADFQQCLLASDATSTGVEPGPPLRGWSVTRYLFEPVLANTTFSYFDLSVKQEGPFLLFLLDRKRGGEFPVDLLADLAASMVAQASV